MTTNTTTTSTTPNQAHQPRYLYIRNKNKFPVACVAIKFDPEKNLINYGISTHCPKDNFNRKLARQIAKDRLDIRNQTINVFPEDNTTTFRGIIKALMTGLAQDETLPTRTRKAVRMWLNTPKSS